MNQFAIATEVNGILMRAKVTLDVKAQADTDMPRYTGASLTDSPIYVINTKAE